MVKTWEEGKDDKDGTYDYRIIYSVNLGFWYFHIQSCIDFFFKLYR